MRADTHKDTLEELRRLALEKEWLAAVAVTQSVEDAIIMAENEYRNSGRGPHMACLVTGSSFLVAEALALFDSSEV